MEAKILGDLNKINMREKIFQLIRKLKKEGIIYLEIIFYAWANNNVYLLNLNASTNRICFRLVVNNECLTSRTVSLIIINTTINNIII